MRRICAEAFAGAAMTFCALVFVGTFLPFYDPYDFSENPSAPRTTCGSLIALVLFFVARWGNRIAGRIKQEGIADNKQEAEHDGSGNGG